LFASNKNYKRKLRGAKRLWWHRENFKKMQPNNEDTHNNSNQSRIK